jgi:hypothetical protein
MDADGTNQRRLTNNEAFDGAPSWSPDGAQLVFASDRDGNDELYVMNSDGAELGSVAVRRLTDNRAADRKPAWQPAVQAPTTVPALAVISLDLEQNFECDQKPGFLHLCAILCSLKPVDSGRFLGQGKQKPGFLSVVQSPTFPPELLIE